MGTGRLMDVRPIYEAYVDRMKRMELPAASLATYIKVTDHIQGAYNLIENPRQHRTQGRDPIRSMVEA